MGLNRDKVSPVDLEARIPDGVAESLTRRIGRFGRGKRRAEEMLSFLRANVPGSEWESHKLNLCGRRLEFKSQDDSDRAFLHAGRFCDQPLICPVDAIRKTAATLRTLMPRLYDLVIGQRLYISLATLTQRIDASESPRESAERLKSAWARWWERGKKSRQRRDGACELAKLVGGRWQIELAWSTPLTRLEAYNRNPSRNFVEQDGEWWHVHMHALWLHRELFDYGKLQPEWHEARGYKGATMNVKLLKACDDFMRGRIDESSYRDELIGDCLEAVKYTLKFHDLPLAQNVEAWLSMKQKRTRLSDGFGVLRGLRPSETWRDPGAPDWELVEHWHTVFDYLENGYQVVKRERHGSPVRKWA